MREDRCSESRCQHSAKIIQLGKTDNQVMTWADYATNRFGGRETGSNAYTDATAWALCQFKQWGLDAELDEVGEVPVGFNRGPWFGKITKPAELALRFGQGRVGVHCRRKHRFWP